MMFSIFRIHSYCVPVFFCVHFHCFGRPRIPAFLELWTAGLLDAGLLDARLLDAGLLECMHTVLEPGRELCASLLYSSTAYVHFNYFRALFAVYRTQYSGLSEQCLNVVGMHAHSAGTRQGAVRIPTVLQHCLRAFLLLFRPWGLLGTASGLLGFKRTLWEVRCITNHRISSAIYFYRISIAIYFYCISISISEMPPDFKTSWRDLYDEICSIGPNIERIISIFSLWYPCAS